MPILEGTDGVQKMSKSLGNFIGLTEPPAEMFGKVMSISDEMMYRYYELLTDMSLAEITAMRQRADFGNVNPMELKVDLARRIISDFHSPQAGREAEENFRRVFQQRQIPAEMETRSVPLDSILAASAQPGDRLIKVDRMLAKAGFSSSASEAARKVAEGAVSINGERWKKPVYPLPDGQTELLVQVGRQHRKVLLESSKNP